MKFQDLRLSEPLLRAIGKSTSTPFSNKPFLPYSKARPPGLLPDRTGKTAAFTLPMLQLLAAEPAP